MHRRFSCEELRSREKVERFSFLLLHKSNGREAEDGSLWVAQWFHQGRARDRELRNREGEGARDEMDQNDKQMGILLDPEDQNTKQAGHERRP